MALGWTRGRRDSTHGTWVSRHALSWRRARRCRCTAAGKPDHVRRALRRRRDGAVGGAAAAGARATRARCPPGGCGRASTAVRACIGLVLPGRWRSVARVGLQAHMLHACVAAGDGRTGTKRPATGAAGQSMPSSEAGKDGRAQEWVTPRGVVPTQCLVPEPTEWSGSPPTGLCLTSPRVNRMERVTPCGVVPDLQRQSSAGLGHPPRGCARPATRTWGALGRSRQHSPQSRLTSHSSKERRALGDMSLSETSMTNTHPGVAQAAAKNAGSVTLGAVRARRNRVAHAHAAWAKEPAQTDEQKRRPSKGGDELQHQNKGQGVSCWAARPLAYPPPLDGSL